MMSGKSVSIIIVSYNVRDLLAECLMSVMRTAGSISCDVTVVDNASNDSTLEMLRSRFPSVRLIANEVNAGFAAANNQGLRAAPHSPYVLLLNPDTVLQPNALEALLGAMERCSDIGILGPEVINPDGTPQSGPLFFPTFVSTLFAVPAAGRRPRQPTKHDGVAEADWVLGACMMIRRKMIDDIGLMDEGYFLYGEEKDWCFRAKQAKWRVGVLLDAEVIHYGGQSTCQRAAQSYEAFIDSQVRFYEKFYPKASRRAYLCNTLLQAGSRRVAARVLGVLNARRRDEWHGRARTYAAGGRRAWEHLTGRRGMDAQ